MKVKVVSNEQERLDAYAVRSTVFIEEQHVPEEEEIDQYEEEAVHFVLYDHEKPIGAGRLLVMEGVGKVQRICVLKEVRGTGAGRAIMNTIEEYAKNEGVHTLKLNAQTHAIPFYEKLGYDITSEEFLDAGIPHRSMKIEL